MTDNIVQDTDVQTEKVRDKLKTRRTVGIYYNNSPLYCIDEDETYFVINGNWSLSKGEGGIKVVFPNMDDMNITHYDEACNLILAKVNKNKG